MKSYGVLSAGKKMLSGQKDG